MAAAETEIELTDTVAALGSQPGAQRGSVRVLSSESSGARSFRGRQMGVSLLSCPSMRRRNESLVPVLQNPFENEACWSQREVLKTVAGALLLLPWRLLGLLVCAVLALFIAGLVSIGVPLEADRGCYRHYTAFGPCRKACVFLLKPLLRCILFFLGFWHVCVLDRREDSAKQANLLVVGPHLGLVDYLLVAMAVPGIPSAVGKSDMAKLPAYFLACACQLILVDVKNKASKATCKEVIALRAGSTWEGPPLIIFPEGYITNGRVLTQYKQGAFLAGEPVTPVLLRMPMNGDWDPSWVGNNRLNMLWVMRLMCQLANHCTVEVLDVYTPDWNERQDPQLYAENVRTLMADELGVDKTEHAYDDVFLYQEALQARVANDFSVAAAKRLLDADLDQLKDWLRTFRKIDIDGSGYITPEELARVLGPGSRDPVWFGRLFSFFDTDGSGAIGYREFVQVLALLSGKCSSASRAKLAFLICDEEGTGKVPKGKLFTAIGQSFAERPSFAHGQPSAQRSSMSEELFGRLTTTADKEELTFADFCRLVEKRPQVLDAAIERVRGRLSLVVKGP
eukprot:CAMPEP_0172812318 /NCGR_PEP_ID=MMETSP1075-20121228/9963_1 /TAXON_ID=2916 /ORGANISM="Ceratium fusus, Strain PA161109" /LENGTH=565 /DNA_ID=CAMNT_0013651855 /DNA_START=78 /DNA_END=1775 /DNA_ORIENTATION=+